MAHTSWSAGNKVARLGEWFGLSQKEWGLFVGVDRATIASYKHRPNASPSQDKVRSVAERLGVPLRWFYDGLDTDPPVTKDFAEALLAAKSGQAKEVSLSERTREMAILSTPSVVALPVWRGAVTGLDHENEFVPSYDPAIEVPGFLLAGGNPADYRILIPSGVSMAPRIVQGDYVLVRKQFSPAPGTLVVAKRPDGVEFIKVYKLNRQGPELHSINGDFPPIVGLDGWEVSGEVTAIWKPYLSKELNLEFGFGSALRG